MAKFVYSLDDVHFSEGFAPDCYATADDKREHKRKRKRVDKADNYSMILDFIDENNIMEFHILRKRITSDFPELLDTLYDKWNMFKAYCDSRRFASAHGFGSMSYDEMANEYKRILHDYDYIRQSSADLRECNDELKAANDKLRKYIMEVAGSSAGDSDPVQFWQHVELSAEFHSLKHQSELDAARISGLLSEVRKLQEENQKLKEQLSNEENLNDYVFLESEEI